MSRAGAGSLGEAVMKARILVVDDDAAVVEFLTEMLEDRGWDAIGVTEAERALARLRDDAFDVVISDVEMPGMRGVELMKAMRDARPGTRVILITAFGSIETAVEAVRAGAHDFITKPFEMQTLYFAVERALRERSLERELEAARAQLGFAGASLVARSPAMRRVVELAERAAQTDATVLLTGESGSGKGAVARFIHERGRRACGPFLAINCAALPATLVESELFGVKRGAFTDAHRDRPGLFAEASGGTVFLDEIGEMPLEMQPKLLLALELGRVRPVGGTEDVAIDARIIAATNAALELALRERRFRPDLYYRLNVIRVDIPPLRERPEDIEPLVMVLLARATARFGREVRGLDPAAWRWLHEQSWPGNVRELGNALERAVALSQGDTLGLEDLTPVAGQAPLVDTLVGGDELPTLSEVERRYIHLVLGRVDGNKLQAAKVLGIDRRTLYRRLEDEPT